VRLSRKQQWYLLSGLASMIAAEVTDHLLTTAYRAIRRTDPPEDLHYLDVGWKQAVLWTAGVGALVGVTELLARQGADRAWRRLKRSKPPRRYRRPRYRSLVAALR